MEIVTNFHVEFFNLKSHDLLKPSLSKRVSLNFLGKNKFITVKAFIAFLNLFSDLQKKNTFNIKIQIHL